MQFWKQLEWKFSSVKSEVHLKFLEKKIINNYTMDGWTMKKKMCNSGEDFMDRMGEKYQDTHWLGTFQL